MTREEETKEAYKDDILTKNLKYVRIKIYV